MKYTTSKKTNIPVQKTGKVSQDIALTDEELLEMISKDDSTFDEYVKMECTTCKYKEKVPKWLIDECNEDADWLDQPKTKNTMLCPNCNGIMVIK